MAKRRMAGNVAGGAALVAIVLAAVLPAMAQMGSGYGGTEPGNMHPGMMGNGNGMMGQGMGPGMMGHGGMGYGPGQAPSETPSSASGAQIFQGQCAACHALRPTASPMVGPELHGLFGRRAGTVPGFSYSAALRGSGIVWTAQTLDGFLAAPQSYVRGTLMAYPGLRNASERQALIHYLEAATR